MRFGLALPQYGFSIPGDAPVGFETIVEWARRAEGLGFDSVWLSDHLFYSFGRYGADPAPISALEPFTSLAGLATITSRARVGVLVACAPFRHPAMLAKMAVTIDVLSGGRLDLGVGAGWLEQEFAAFGLPFGSVGERFGVLRETLDVLRLLGSDVPLTYHGPRVELRDARVLPRPTQDRIPIWVGGKGGPRLLRLAAELADGWNTVWRIDLEDYAERVAAARRACEAVDRDPTTFRLSVGLHTLVGDTETAARETFERGRASFPGGAMESETWASWSNDTLSGSPEQAIDRIGELEAIGVEEIVISPWVLPFAVHEHEIVDVFSARVISPLAMA
jgi:probable F420-dependent oxidoreductase